MSISSISAFDADLTNDSNCKIDSQTECDISISDEVSTSYACSDADSHIQMDMDSSTDAISDSTSPDNYQQDDGKFSTLQEKINDLDEDGTLILNNNYTDNDLDNGININKNIKIEGNGYALDANNKSRIFTIADSKKVVLNNITFINGYSEDNGGAIYIKGDSTFNNFTDLSFINNHAGYHGGAIYIEGDTSFNNFTNVILKNNSALRGGGIYFVGNLLNNSLNFIASQNHINNFSGAVFFVERNALYNIITGQYFDNHADDHCAGVLYIKGNITGNIFEGYFENNTALAETGGIMTLMGTARDNTFKGSFYNNSARIGGAIYFYLPSYNNTFIGEFINNSVSKSGSAIYFRGSPSNLIVNSSFIDNKAASNTLNISLIDSEIKATLTGHNNIINALNAPDMDNLAFENITYWSEKGLVNSDDTLPIFNNLLSGENITLELYKNNKLSYKTISTTNKDGIALLNYPKLDPGNYTYLVYHADNSYYGHIEQSGSIIIPKLATALSISNMKAIYNTGKYAIISLKDKDNNAIKNAKIIIEINGKKYTKTTDKNGKVKFLISKLVPKTYNAKIRFDGDDKFLSSSKSVKIIVQKAKPKLYAKKKTFKLKTKTKKYAVTLKNNMGKAMKKTKVILKINGKTYKVKTNKKGKAIFKITKFRKKCKIKAIIKFSGNEYYKSVKKTVRITIK